MALTLHQVVSLLIVLCLFNFQQAHAFTHTIKSFALSQEGVYFASQENAIMRMMNLNELQAVACDPTAQSRSSGDNGDATLEVAGCTLSTKQGTLQVLPNGRQLFFVNGELSLRMVENGRMKTILEDDMLSSMYVNRFNEIIYISAGNLIKKRLSNGEVQVLAGGSECVGEQDGLSALKSCVQPSHIVQDDSKYDIVYFYDEKVRAIRKLQNDIITTVSGTNGFSIFDVRSGVIHCSNGHIVKRVEKNKLVKIVVDADLQISQLKMSQKWIEDGLIYVLSNSGNLRTINSLGQITTIVNAAIGKLGKTRTISQTRALNETNSSVNGTLTDNSTSVENVTSSTDYHPTPILSSQVSQDGSGIRFLLTFGKSNVYTHRLFYSLDSAYDTKLCKNTYSNRTIPMTLYSESTLTQNYTTDYIPLANLIGNPSVDKRFVSDSLQLTINLALEYIDDNGLFNGGFCKAIIFKTQQVVNIFYSTSISSKADATYFLDYSYKIYPQLITTDGYSGASSLIVELMLETNNVTIQQFSFHNSTNPNSNFVVNLLEWQFLRGNYNYTKISMKTSSRSYDFTGTSLFFSKFQSKDGFVFSDYIPFVINYLIVIPPESQNTTVQYSLYISGSNLSPKSSFTIGESLYVRLNAYFSYGTLKLRAKSAYLCCMKEFSPAPIYDPSNNLNGCNSYNSSTMDVWKPLFANFIPNQDVEISDLSITEGTHLFFFQLKKEYFPLKKSYKAACYIQTTAGLQQPSRRLAHSVSYQETVVQSLSVQVNSVIETSSSIEPSKIESVASNNFLSLIVIFSLSVLINFCI